MIELAETERFSRNYSKAYSILREVEDSIHRMPILDQLQLYKTYTKLDSASQNFTKAYGHLSTYLALKDSFLNEEKNKELASSQTRFETEAKERQIEFLEKENNFNEEKLAQQKRNILFFIIFSIMVLALAGFAFYQRNKYKISQKRLAKSLGKKESLLKEIHHRVKNNLQLIMSLLNLQADEDGEQSLEYFLEKGRHRVKSTALIHE